MAADVDQLTDAFVRQRAPQQGQPAYRITVIGGCRNGTHQRFEGREIRIGKDPSNHLCIPDPTVSRYHCLIERRPRGLLLRDLESTNGTQLGGHWIECAYLSPHVPFTIGDTTLQIELEPAAGLAERAHILGHSVATTRLLASLPRVAGSPVTVLIEGETGTGKSLLAELIHRQGPRAEKPFVVVDCGAIPATLIESELFGHERGSFTGAVERHIGAFEAAQGGTLFLDEVGELPLALQPKLLRAIEERTIKRVGSTKPTRIDVRVIAATNRELREAVGAGQFRADLYYRLEAIRLQMPALRERQEDIPALIEQFARRLQPGIGAAVLEDVQRLLAARKDWPGNVRELRNAVEKVLVLGDLGTEPTASAPLPAGAPPEFDGSRSFKMAKEEAMVAWEQSYLASLLRHAKGNVSQAARVAQMDRSHLRDLLRRYRLAGVTTELER
jgi:DNA-binding NtrC family response regulator